MTTCKITLDSGFQVTTVGERLTLVIQGQPFDFFAHANITSPGNSVSHAASGRRVMRLPDGVRVSDTERVSELLQEFVAKVGEARVRSTLSALG
jgi:hypothetical protein